MIHNFVHRRSITEVTSGFPPPTPEARDVKPFHARLRDLRIGNTEGLKA